jgi:hypothetical protein
MTEVQPWRRDKSMQFVLLIYQGKTPYPSSTAWESLPQQERKAFYAQATAGYDAINRADGVTPGLPLGLPENATTVRVEDGKTLTSDGPYLGTAAQAVGGYYVVEAADLDAATELASRIPSAQAGGAVEVRPVARYW